MRKWLSIISAILLLLAVLVIACIWQVNRVLKTALVEDLRYQVASLDGHGIHLSTLSFLYSPPSYPQVVQVKNLRVDWKWQRFLPHLQLISAQQIVVKGLRQSAQKSTAESSAQSPAFKLPSDWQLPEFFPLKIHVMQLKVEQPCAEGICMLTAQIDLTASDREKIDLAIVASPGDQINAQHQLQINATYSVKDKLPAVESSLAIDQKTTLQLATHLEQTTELFWLGTLKGSVSYVDDWWISQLKTWGVKNLKESSQQLAAANFNVDSNWHLALTPLLHVPAGEDINPYLRALSGRLFLDASFPKDFQFPGLGQFSGGAKAELKLNKGQVKNYSLLVDLSAEQLNLPDSWKLYGVDIDKAKLNVQSQEEGEASLASLPFIFFAETQGAIAGKFSGHIFLDAFNKKIIADHLSITAKAKKLTPYTEYEFSNIDVNVQAVAYWQPENFSFNVSQPSQVSADLNIPSFTLAAKKMRVMTNKLTLAGKMAQGALVWPELSLGSDVIISVDKLSSSQLKPNAWRWQGTTKGVLKDFNIQGDLKIGTGLNVHHTLKGNSSRISGDWNLADIFFIAANPFTDAVKAWPPLLSLARGKLNAKGTFEYNIQNKILEKSASNIQIEDVAGIYDTTAFEGVGTEAVVSTANKTFTVATGQLRVNQINKGFMVGPVQFAGVYRAGWQNPLQGKLALEHFTGSVAKGTFGTSPQRIDFSQATQKFIVNFQKINLANVLQQYPASELSGSGQVSGNIPIEISKKGICVIKGSMAAETPGGKLKYHSARAIELAKSQPSMKLLTEALNDFQYSVLNSEINYDEAGQLVLSIKLEGQNPKLEKGRPIHFNINFEENIPALLASIQLSSKVNDVIKKRLQEYLQHKPESGVISIKK